MKIIQAQIEQIDDLVPLFDEYRVFYEQRSSTRAARAFLQTNIEQKHSIIFIIYDRDNPAGFTQLYPSFSSVSMQKLYILNDLYVRPAFRNRGFGEKLLVQAQKYVREFALKGLTLETAIDNPAQHLYERLGWTKDETVFHYTWENLS